MAAGTVMLAHDSGGPQMDIVVDFNGQPTGFLASDHKSFAAAMHDIFAMTPPQRLTLRQNARESLARFSEQEFASGFVSLCGPLLKHVTATA